MHISEIMSIVIDAALKSTNGILVDLAVGIDQATRKEMSNPTGRQGVHFEFANGNVVELNRNLDTKCLEVAFSLQEPSIIDVMEIQQRGWEISSITFISDQPLVS
jgi:hypothetical protein